MRRLAILDCDAGHIDCGWGLRDPQGVRLALPGPADVVSRGDPVHPSGPAQCLAVPEAGQWLVTTCSRLAGNGYSWLQAVYWVAETECYQPARRHGPRFGATSLTVARILATLSPCRPGVGYLSRQLKLSERTVKYHLGMLREAGLLAYVVRGSRAAGGVGLASEFALVIPPQFDAALGVRTAGEGPQRRPVGIAEDGRRRMTALGLLAVGDPRRATVRSLRPGRAGSRPRTLANSQERNRCCTPMESSSGGVSSTRTSCLPPDGRTLAQNVQSAGPKRSDVAAGERTEPPTSRPDRLGRRFRLARELIEQIPWLGRAALPRVAWVAREVADAGWHVVEVAAWLGLSAPPARVRRPSAFLAHRLKGAHLVAATPAQRANLVEAWRDQRVDPVPDREEWEGPWRPPTDPAVRATLARALAAPTPRSAIGVAETGLGDPGPGPEEDRGPSPDEIADLRAAGRRDPSLVRAAMDMCGAEFAARIYTPRLVEIVRTAQCGGRGRGRLRLHAPGGDTEHG